MTEIEELYHRIIREHSSQPRHFHILEHYTHSAHRANTLCGDEITVYCRLLTENAVPRIEDISFDAAGCAIMKASASLMTDNVKSCTVERALHLVSSFTAFVQGDSSAIDSDSPFTAFAPVRQYPSRITCAVLPFQALAKALQAPFYEVSGPFVQ